MTLEMFVMKFDEEGADPTLLDDNSRVLFSFLNYSSLTSTKELFQHRKEDIC